MANPQASPLLHNHNHLSFFRFQTTYSPPPSFTSPHFKKPLLFLSSSFPSQQCNHQVRRVSTVPVEYSTPTPPESDDDFSSEIDRLKSLLTKLDVSKDLRRKEAVIDDDSRVRRFFSENRGGLGKVFGSVGLDSREMFLVKCVIAAGQEHALCVGFEEEEEEEEEYTVRSSVKNALYALVEMIERFDVNSRDRRETCTVLDAEEVAHFRKFLTFLGEIEQFYDCIGGIIGYHFSTSFITAT